MDSTDAWDVSPFQETSIFRPKNGRFFRGFPSEAKSCGFRYPMLRESLCAARWARCCPPVSLNGWQTSMPQITAIGSIPFTLPQKKNRHSQGLQFMGSKSRRRQNCRIILVGGFDPFEMMTFPIYGKIQIMFQSPTRYLYILYQSQ